VLSHFGKRKDPARRRYQDFDEKGVREGENPQLTGGGLL